MSLLCYLMYAIGFCRDIYTGPVVAKLFTTQNVQYNQNSLPLVVCYIFITYNKRANVRIKENCDAFA